MEQALTSDARPIPEHVVDGLVRFDHAGLLTEEDRREMIRRIQLDLLHPRRERPRGSGAEKRYELAASHHSITSSMRKSSDLFFLRHVSFPPGWRHTAQSMPAASLE